MKNIKIYRVMCNEYTDTRMGATNPYYQIGKTVTSLEGCKKEIVAFLKKKGKTVKRDYPDFKITSENWSHDFVPWIMSIKTELVKA